MIQILIFINLIKLLNRIVSIKAKGKHLNLIMNYIIANIVSSFKTCSSLKSFHDKSIKKI